MQSRLPIANSGVALLHSRHRITQHRFSHFLCYHCAHRYIKAPKDTSGEEQQAQQALRKKHKAEEDAFGTYASQGGEKFVYRVKKEGGFGGYKVSLV
jgi:hypothetical protein